MKNTINDLTRINNDVNGNPRYVVHYLALSNDYNEAVSISRGYGGKKYRAKSYGGGIVFQCYDEHDLVDFLNENSVNLN